MDGLTDSAVINDSIIKPLMHGLRNFTPASTGRKSKVERINDVLLSVGEIETAADLDTAISRYFKRRLRHVRRGLYRMYHNQQQGLRKTRRGTALL